MMLDRLNVVRVNKSNVIDLLYSPRVCLGLVLCIQWVLLESFGFSWVSSFLRIGNQHFYIALFFLMLGVTVISSFSCLRNWKRGRLFGWGVVVGHLLAIITLIIYSLFLPDGLARVGNSLKHGIGAYFLIQNWLGLMLGGGAFGAISFCVIEFIDKVCERSPALEK